MPKIIISQFCEADNEIYFIWIAIDIMIQTSI